MKSTATNSKVLNLFLVCQFEKEQSQIRITQRQGIKSQFNIHRPADGSYTAAFIKDRAKISDELPNVQVKPEKWANISINHNLQEFLRANDLLNSGNPFNDHSRFDGVPVLQEGWITPPLARTIERSPRVRHSTYSDSNMGRFQMIFSICSFDKNSPIILDRNGRVLDGYQRLYVLATSGDFSGKIYVKVLDFE